MSLTIREPARLELATDRIHDRWCDVDAMTYDAATRALRIPFWSQLTRSAPMNRLGEPTEPFDGFLVVHGADEPTIEDPEGIGAYTFVDIVVRGNQLAIRAEPNLRIMCAIQSLHVTVGEDDS